MMKFKNTREAMLYAMVKTEMVDYVHQCMTENLDHVPTIKALSEFFSAEGKKKIGGFNYWQQCFAIEKALEFYHDRAKIATAELHREHDVSMERLLRFAMPEDHELDESEECHG